MNRARTLGWAVPSLWTAASVLGVGLAMAVLVPVLSGPAALYVLFGILGLVGTWGLVHSPCLGVGAILVVWVSDISPALGGQRFLTVPYLVTGVLLVPLGLALVRDRALRILDVPQIRILLAIGAMHLLATLWSEVGQFVPVLPDRDSTQRDAVIFASRLLFLVFVFYFVTTRARIEALLWIVVGVIVASAALSWGPLLLGGSVRRAESSLLGMNSNRLALLALFASAVIWSARSAAEDPRWKTIGFGVLLALAATALASGSRSGLLQAVALCALILVERRKGPSTQQLRTFALLAGGALFILIVVPTSLLERTTRFDTSMSAPGGGSLQSRIAQHEAALQIYLDHPVLGIGMGNFEPLAGEQYYVDNTLHNSYLLALIEGGPVLLGLYLWMFLVTWRQLRWIEHEGPPDLRWLAQGLRYGLALFLIASAAADQWLSEHLYLIVGLTIALSALPRSPASTASRKEEPAG